MSLPVVTLSPDYGAPSPLWPLSDETDALVPPELLRSLLSWQRDFDANFHHENGWRSDAARERWAAEADRLEVQVRMALVGRAELTVNLWPLRSAE